MQKIVLTQGLSSADELHNEISTYVNVLLGHENPPLEDGVETLFELSSAYLARAREIEIKLLERERSNSIATSDDSKRFRTGELRSFIDLCKRAQDQGSRRITIALSELNLKEN